MQYDVHLPDSHEPFHGSRFAWAALALALAFGIVEWLALARSRGADRLGALLRALNAHPPMK